jgi:hypothetical protein
MTEPNQQDKEPPVAIYRALQQIEEMLTSSEQAISVCSSGPDSVLWQKWQFLKISLLVRKYWGHLPESYFVPLLRAAIYEADPSWNRDFLTPALRAFGHRKVQEVLLQYLEQGTPREQAGALRAWYWAWKPCDEDLRGKRDSFLLKRFVECEDLAVQRSIIFFLSLNPSDYSQACQPLIPTAIHLARTHPDAFVRQQVAEKLRRQGLES